MIKKQEREQFHDKEQEYISMLSKLQVKILGYLMEGYKAFEIRQVLGLSKREYADNLRIMRSYENVKVLF